MKKYLAGSICAILCVLAFPNEQTSQSLYERCLNYREQNSPAFIKVQNEAIIAENSYRQQRIASYVAAQLGSGNVNLNFSDDGLEFGMEPFASISLPFLNNLNFGLNLPFAKSEKGSMSGINFSVGIDIYSKAYAKHKLAQKAALQAKNAAVEQLAYGKQIVEAEFLSDSKEIMNAYIDYVNKQLAKVSSAIEFRKIEIEGYAKSSTRYKAAQLKALAAERQAKTIEKIFFKNANKFFASCGIEKQLTLENFETEAERFFSELAESIPEKEIFDTALLHLENSKKFIEVKQNYERTIETRKIENSSFTLSANAGVSISQNKITVPVVSTQNNKSMSGGLTFKFPGLSLSSGVTLNFDKPKNPSLNFSLIFNPLEIYYKVLSDKNAKLQTEIDTLNFKTETEKCEEQVQNAKSNAENLQLIKEAANYEYDIYKQNADDIQKLFTDGFTTKLDNAQAHLEFMQSLIKFAQAKTEIILFNIQNIQSFVIESKMQGEQ